MPGRRHRRVRRAQAQEGQQDCLRRCGHAFRISPRRIRRPAGEQRTPGPGPTSGPAARPGARRDILESYVKRLEKLEGIADSFKGVSKSFALQAGREIRIMVESEKISDEEAIWLSKDIARRIENELEYPGQIKVTVIRETRAVDYAK